MDDALPWRVRAAIYDHFVATGQAPSVAAIAARLDSSSDEARTAFRWLNEHHAIFLEPGADLIRMANPFSALPTDFRVVANGKSYWANCAWDALGIPAALHADAVITATRADDGGISRLTVANGAVGGADEVAHFLLPFARWYEDLIFT